MATKTMHVIDAGTPEPAPPAEADLCETSLSYVSPDDPGFVRQRSGRGFRYLDLSGSRIGNGPHFDRIRALVIPPAWTSVWICADASGHIQATGRDAKGRKQYIYHPEFRAFRDRNKFEHLVAFVEALPKIRSRVAEDMAERSLSRERVLATVVALLERTLIRVGNESYARDNGSYGLTTMRDPHVTIEGARLRFLFKGKSGKEWNLELRDRRLATTVRACQDVPGQKLFQYYDEGGARHAVTSSDLNSYLRSITDTDVTAKDFRTWAGTVLAATTLRDLAAAENPLPLKKRLRVAVTTVAARLGNTPTVARQCYIHPEVFSAFETGGGLPLHPRRREIEGLSRDEAEVLWFLQERIGATREAA